MSRTADVVVVGAGVIGSAIALELTRAGYDVCSSWDKSAGPGHGSTSASSAIIRFTYSTYAGVATAWESKFCWEEWAEHLALPERAGPTALAAFRRTGMLSLDSPLVPRARQVALLREVGVPVEELDAETLRTRYPYLDNGRYWPPRPVDDDSFADDAVDQLGGFLTPDAGFVDDPRLAADNLATAARGRGARFAFHSTITGLDPVATGGWRVRLSGADTVEAAVVVNAAGPWSSALNRLAGVGAEFTVGVRPLRQEVHQVSAPREYDDGDGALGPAIGDTDLGVLQDRGPADDAVGLPDRVQPAAFAQIDPAPETIRGLKRVFHDPDANCDVAGHPRSPYTLLHDAPAIQEPRQCRRAGGIESVS